MEDPRLIALNLIEQDESNLYKLWLRYWANGGDAHILEFVAYVHGISERDAFDQRILGWAIEELRTDS